MKENNVLVLEQKTYTLPSTMQSLGYDNFFIIPLDAIHPADKDDESVQDYHWVNPRHYEAVGEAIPVGFEKPELDSLSTDIRDDGLIYNIVCRWVLIDGELQVEILDGERRWRCIKQLIAENASCFDKISQKWLPASELYKNITCKVYMANDKESFKIAYMTSNRHVKWGDGANVRAIKHLRSAGCNDDEILELTKKTGQWLREEDKLCELDDYTFNCYSSKKINRAVAIRLAGVMDMSQRHLFLKETMHAAEESSAKRLAKLDEEILKLEDQEEVAESQLAEAQLDGDEAKIEIAEENLGKVQEVTKAKKKERSRGSQGKTKDLRQAVSNLCDENEDENAEPLPESVVQSLRPGKIKKQLECLEELLNNDGMKEGVEVIPVLVLNYVVAAYQAILNGEEDIEKVMKRQKKIVEAKREQMLRNAHENRKAKVEV